MQFSVSSYSFSRLYREGKLDLLGAVGEAKRLGFDAIELVDILDHKGERSGEEYARLLCEQAGIHGIAVSNLTFSANFLGGDIATEIERVKRYIDLAPLVGAKSVRHDASWTLGTYPSFDAALPELAAAIREVSVYAATLGVTTMVENHGYIIQHSTRMEKLFNTVNHPNFKLLCDIGNFMCADENPVEAVSRVAPYAAYVHVKDFHVKPFGSDPGSGFFPTLGGNLLRGAIIGHGEVPVKQCLAILKRAGFDGTVAIEFEGVEDTLPALEISRENLIRYAQV